jgi:isopentenyl diphosphate isomerase/L-lactate dehydrogenase-like FMN-dependent dehydrogenase
MDPFDVNEPLPHDGEQSVVRACVDTSVPYIVSAAASALVEEMREAAGDGVKRSHLYLPMKNDGDTLTRMLHLAQQTRCEVLIVTFNLRGTSVEANRSQPRIFAFLPWLG